MKKINQNTLNLIKITNIDTLVISGGGVAGFLFIGVIKLLFELGIIKNIKKYYGASFGGIVSVFLNLGWDINEILKFSINFPISCIIDFDISTLINNYGLVPIDNYKALIKKIITFKGFDEDITFKELYEKTSKEINLIGFSLKNNSTIILNYLNTPNMKIWEGAYITSALPILIPPYEYNDDILIDGAMCDNFPMNKLKPDELYNSIGININMYYPDWDNLSSFIKEKDIINYITYTFELIKLFFLKKDKCLINNHFNISMNTLNDDIKKNLSFNFTIEDSKKKIIIDEGYKQALEQIDDIILLIYKNQIDQRISSNQYIPKKKLFKFHEI